MKAFLVTAGGVFGLVVVVHLYRMTIEPNLVHDPFFWLITAVSAALSVWAWRLVWPSRRA
jgi:hypothetical protein